MKYISSLFSSAVFCRKPCIKMKFHVFFVRLFFWYAYLDTCCTPQVFVIFPLCADKMTSTSENKLGKQRVSTPRLGRQRFRRLALGAENDFWAVVLTLCFTCSCIYFFFLRFVLCFLLVLKSILRLFRGLFDC